MKQLTKQAYADWRSIRAWNAQGQLAYRLGKSISDCPHASDSTAARAWRAGWKEANLTAKIGKRR